MSTPDKVMKLKDGKILYDDLRTREEKLRPYKNASGSIVSFEDDIGGSPLKECKVSFSLIQAGSGDPSPSNVRPINGWTGITGYKCGKNLLNKNAYGYKTYSMLTFGGTNLQSDGSFILQAGTYTFSTSVTMSYLAIEHEDRSFDMLSNASSMTFTCQSKEAVRITAILNVTDQNHDMLQYNYQLELGSIATAYEAYNGSNYLIDWTTEAGTVYGGTVDLITGVLTADWIAYDLTLNNWTSSEGGIFYQDFDPNWYAVNLTVLCSNYKTRNGNTSPKNGELLYWPRGDGKAPRILICDTSKSSLSAEEFKNAMSGVQLIYKINNPTTYQLTPQQIKTLIGTNTVWSNGDSINVTYPVNLQDYIDESTIDDVQINGTSVVSNGVANVPIAGSSTLGVVYTNSNYGITANESGRLTIQRASASEIKGGTKDYNPIVPMNMGAAAFYGLAKITGDTTQSQSDNSPGTYTPAAKAAIQKMLGITDIIGNEENSLTASKAYSVGEVLTANGKLYRVTAAIAQDGAIVVEGAGQNVEEISVAEDYVKFSDVATADKVGVVKPSDADCIQITADGTLKAKKASDTTIRHCSGTSQVLVPSQVNKIAFYGLAQAAGMTVTTSAYDTVGTYPADAKSAIQSMLGVPGDVQVNGTSVVQNGVANIPVASTDTFGTIKTNSAAGIDINSETGKLKIASANGSEVRLGTDVYKPIVPGNEHTAVFYGLAKAAGDTTQRSIVFDGVYTSEAKAAIHTMLGIDPAAIAALVEIPLVETISGTDPVITGQANYRYECGECYTLSITPPATGTIDVLFTSGSTATVLTLASGVVTPEWFDPNSLDTDTVYEILITNGTYGSVMTWPVPAV